MVEGSSGVKRRSRLVRDLSHSLVERTLRPNKRPRRDVVDSDRFFWRTAKINSRGNYDVRPRNPLRL
jgi:hypothetical protein